MPNDEWFAIENTSSQTLKVKLDAVLEEPLRELVTLQILSRVSNVPLSSVSLVAGEVLEVRVRVQGRDEAKIPARLAHVPLVFGSLLVTSEMTQQDVTERVVLRGSLVPGATFSLSISRLNFRCAPRPPDAAPVPVRVYFVHFTPSCFINIFL